MNKPITSPLLALAVAMVLGLGCSDNADDGSGANGPPAGPSDPVIAPSGGSVRAPYQIKSSAEIASALAACFGQGVTKVEASMLQTPENPEGFLSSRQFAAGDDVVKGEAFIIDGDPAVERTGVRNATISLPILSALQDIGNVVGENCAAQLQTNAKCKCATRGDAHAMLTRCLPSIAPSAYSKLEDGFAAACAKDTAGGIASLVASTAFGVR
jgi:hypothetical protein